MFTWKIRGKMPNSKPYKEEDGFILFEPIAPGTTPGKQNIPMQRGWAEPPSAAQNLGCCDLVPCGSWLNFGVLKAFTGHHSPRGSIRVGDTKAALGTCRTHPQLIYSPTNYLFTHKWFIHPPSQVIYPNNSNFLRLLQPPSGSQNIWLGICAGKDLQAPEQGRTLGGAGRFPWERSVSPQISP